MCVYKYSSFLGNTVGIRTAHFSGTPKAPNSSGFGVPTCLVFLMNWHVGLQPLFQLCAVGHLVHNKIISKVGVVLCFQSLYQWYTPKQCLAARELSHLTDLGLREVVRLMYHNM